MSSAAEGNARVEALGRSKVYGDLDARGEAERRNGLREVPARYVKPLSEWGYWSTCLGKAVWIRNDMRNAVPKRREDCTPFSYTLADGGDAVAQERFVKGLAKLERAEARAAKARAPKVSPVKAAKVATVRMRAGAVLEVVGLPRGYTFQVEEVA